MKYRQQLCVLFAIAVMDVPHVCWAQQKTAVHDQFDVVIAGGSTAAFAAKANRAPVIRVCRIGDSLKN